MASPKMSEPMVLGWKELFELEDKMVHKIPEGYQSTEDISKETGKSLSSVQKYCKQWRKEGKVEYVKDGNKYYYKR